MKVKSVISVCPWLRMMRLHKNKKTCTIFQSDENNLRSNNLCFCWVDFEHVLCASRTLLKLISNAKWISNASPHVSIVSVFLMFLGFVVALRTWIQSQNEIMTNYLWKYGFKSGFRLQKAKISLNSSDRKSTFWLKRVFHSKYLRIRLKTKICLAPK